MKVLVKTAVLAVSLIGMAQANVSISASSYQEKTKLSEDGQKVKAWVKADKVVPGTVIRYVNALKNSGNKLATKLVVDNPIPENMIYVGDSASCQTGCSLFYSVDGGKHYKKPEALFVGLGEERHVAEASEYTHIRWIVERLDAVSQSTVEFKAQLK